MGNQILLLLLQTAVKFPLEEVRINYIGRKPDQLFAKRTRVSKKNISLGYILANSETNEHQYHYSNDNTTLFPKPKLMGSFEQFKMMKQDLFYTDFVEKFRTFRDSTNNF